MGESLHKQLKLCLVTNIQDQSMSEYISFVTEAVHGGVSMVQLRETGTNMNVIKNRALALQEVLRPLNVPLMINNWVELAAEIDADGVHLGANDMDPITARKILGVNKIIGRSIDSWQALVQSNQIAELGYVTASAVYPSKIKPDCKKLWGLAGLQQIVQLSRHPVTAIGGIKLHNIADVVSTGIHGVAVIGAIHDACNAYKAACALRSVMV